MKMKSANFFWEMKSILTTTYCRDQKMDIKTDQEFVQWMKRAVSTSDDCYIELYNLLLRSSLLFLVSGC